MVKTIEEQAAQHRAPWVKGTVDGSPRQGGWSRKRAVERLSKVKAKTRKEAEEVERMDYLEFIARVVSHIPDKGQVTIRCFGLYASAHRGKVRKSEKSCHKLLVIEEDCPRVPRRSWAEMIPKVYEADPLLCPKCGRMRIIAFLTDHAVVDRFIDHLKMAFIASKPPPPSTAYQEVLVAAATPAECFYDLPFSQEKSFVGFQALLVPRMVSRIYPAPLSCP